MLVHFKIEIGEVPYSSIPVRARIFLLASLPGKFFSLSKQKMSIVLSALYVFLIQLFRNDWLLFVDKKLIDNYVCSDENAK